MNIFRIKNYNFLYKIKIIIREYKGFIKTVFFLFLIKTPQKLINSFIFNFFYNSRIKSNIDRYVLSNKYLFSDSDWFFEKLPLFVNFFDKNLLIKNNIQNILEIGSYEGRSSIFFNKFFNLKSFTAVDTWQGSEEHNDQIKKKMKEVEYNFDRNLSEFNNITKIKTCSNNFFKQNKKNYDLIFIDGSHKKIDFANDLKNSFKILNKNGYILIDDYDFFYYKLNDNVSSGFNEFYLQKESEIKIIYLYRQVLFKKII